MFPQAVEDYITPKSFDAIPRLIAALLIVAAGAGGALAQADPATVQQQLLDALARGDVQAALALFTEDAVIDSESGLCAKAPCVGKAAIQKDFERYVADKSRRATPLKTYVSGDVMVTRFEARSGPGGGRGGRGAATIIITIGAK